MDSSIGNYICGLLNCADDSMGAFCMIRSYTTRTDSVTHFVLRTDTKCSLESQDGHMSFDLNPEWIQTSRSLRGTFDLFVKSR